VWESNNIKEFRNTLLSGGQPEGCNACWSEEASGKQSKRQRENSRWGTNFTTVPRSLDLKLGNTCNLKCRICGPTSSSQWIKEHEAVSGGSLLKNLAISVRPSATQRMIMQWPEYNDRFWTDLELLLPTVELFEIYGGEPFLSKRHYNLLRRSIELGYSGSQRVHYNSNGTIYPVDAVEQIWPNFKRVDIMLSIDGIGKQFEYQRHPAQWDQVEENLFKFKEALGSDLEICCTVSALNIFYLPEYIMYFEKLGVRVWVNNVYHPASFSINNLPDSAKQAVLTKLTGFTSEVLIEPIQPILNYMMTAPTQPTCTLLNTIRIHDEYRNEHYADTFPEFAAFLYS
jgi:sulfatase maturation enzyme AslB (radical SAM superfamily)